MPLTIAVNALKSRAIRKSATGGRPRLLDFNRPLAPTGTKEKPGIFKRVTGWISNIFEAAKRLWGGITGIYDWLVNGVEQLKNFDWNASDADLDATIARQNQTIYGIWGSALGRTAGWIAGIAVGSGIALVCPVIGGSALARTVAAGVAPEALAEVTGGIVGALRQTLQIKATNQLIRGYMKFRQLLKKSATSGRARGILFRYYMGVNKLLNPNASTSELRSLAQSDLDFIANQWGAQGGPQYSFNSVMDEVVESISNKNIKQFVENFLEESWESFIEAGFIVAQELDSAYAQAKQAVANTKGADRVVEVTFDKDAPQEKLLIAGKEDELRPQIIQAINTHRLIHNRDVGMVALDPTADLVKPQLQRRLLSIEFRERQAPPWRMPDGKRPRIAMYSVPDVITSLSWEKIKLAARRYTWGGFRATAHLDNGRQMAVYGASKAEAKTKVLELLKLSNAKVLSLNVSEEDVRPISTKKRPTVMYPAWATLTIRKPTTNPNKGFVGKDGKRWEEDIIKIPLYPSTEPPDLPSLVSGYAN